LIGTIVLIVALVLAFAIVVSKFGLLANIDVDQVSGEKERALKQQIIADRLRRRLGKFGFFMIRSLKPISKFLRNNFDVVYDTLNAWQRTNVNREAELHQEIDKRIEMLLREAEEMTRAERLEAAEKKYIEIIGMDPKNFSAFRELGEVYYRNQSLNEARQTLEHALHLREKANEGSETPDLEIAQTYYFLALIHEDMGDLTKAMTALKKALKIENNSPRYLDRLIEVSILKKDKTAANSAYKKLAAANPENQKLVQFKERIAEL